MEFRKEVNYNSMNKVKSVLWLLISIAVLTGCNSGEENREANSLISYDSLKLPDQPNILWIVAEDLSPRIPVFGDSTVETPNISRLASEGVVYANFNSPSPVCAPTRAAIATGMYPTRIGAHHMRTGPWFRFTIKDRAIENFPRKAYEAIPPTGTHMMSTYIRKEGYYCSNNPKEDYQFRCEMTAWDESSFQAHWNKRKPGQPFFAIFNLDNTHESMIWRKSKDSLLVEEDLEVPVEPYLPSTEEAKKDIRRLYSNIVEMDNRVGEILKELEDSGELENTIIFWYTDHGGPLPREKRTIYQTGLHSPLIIRFPDKQFAGRTDHQLISFIDLKPTTLSLLNILPPDYVDGRAWMGKYRDDNKRKYLFASADRFDNETDMKRSVFDGRYKLIRNYFPERPYYLPVGYRETMPIMKELLRLRDKDSLTYEQSLWFRPEKDSIELFDTWNDPYEFKNLASNPDLAPKVAELKTALNNWITETEDKGMMTEEEYMMSIWPNGEQPVTEAPEIFEADNGIQLISDTEGASIGYQWVQSETLLTNTWEIYKGPFQAREDMILVARAHRIGYRPSEESKSTY